MTASARTWLSPLRGARAGERVAAFQIRTSSSWPATTRDPSGATARADTAPASPLSDRRVEDRGQVRALPRGLLVERVRFRLAPEPLQGEGAAHQVSRFRRARLEKALEAREGAAGIVAGGHGQEGCAEVAVEIG